MTTYTDNNDVHMLSKHKSNVTVLHMTDNLSQEDRACRTLWLAVIHQAMFDLISSATAPDEQAAFKKWFFMQSNSFNFICSLAGVAPDAIRQRAREVLLNPKLLGNPHV